MIEPTLDDYIRPLIEQRDAALNEVVNLRAQISAMQREMEQLRSGNAEKVAD